MEFHQIRYFLKTAETLNFTRASEQCYVSQPALTRAIQKLEGELGGDLFKRDGRSVSLTKLGGIMREHCQRIQETQEMTRSVAKTFLENGASELNVGIMCTIGPDVLSEFVNEFRKKHNNVLLILHDIGPEALPELLLTGALDCAFIAVHDDKTPKDILVQNLFEEKMVVAFSNGHRFAEKQEVTLYDVAEEIYVDRLKCEIRQPFFNFMKNNNFDLQVACSSQRDDWIQELVIHGVGVSVMPQFSITTQRIDWRPITGPLSNARNIMIAKTKEHSRQSAVESFFKDAKNFRWQETLKALEDHSRLH